MADQTLPRSRAIEPASLPSSIDFFATAKAPRAIVIGSGMVYLRLDFPSIGLRPPMLRLNCVLIERFGLPPPVVFARRLSTLPDLLNIIPRFFLNVLLPLLRLRLFL